MSKFPKQLGLVSVATVSAVALSVGISERMTSHADGVASHEMAQVAETHSEAIAPAPETTVAQTEAEPAEETTEEPATEMADASAASETTAIEQTTADTTGETVVADASGATPEAADTFEAGTSRPASIIGAAWAQESSSPTVGDLDGISFGLGRAALPEEVAAWNIDVRPDGAGLPEGSGDVWTGEEVFVEKCSSCHGDFGEAVGRWPVLAGGWDTLEDADPVKTIGSYWPYLSTVWDYVHRAMPFGQAQTLTNDEVYAITAYLLYVNNLVEDDFELSKANFTETRLPNEPNFFMDDRAEGEIPAFSQEPCMENCKGTVEIAMRATVLDVTPDTGEDETVDAAAEGESTTEATDAVTAADTDEAVASTDESVMEEAAAAETEEGTTYSPDPALVAEGENVFRKCRSCHQVGDGATNRTGPELNGVLGRTIGSVEGFRYSSGFMEANQNGEIWDHDNLAAFFANPREARPGTKMSFAGLRSQEEIDAIIAYLSTFP